ncbi:MAG: 16S rRNA (adenine(1518)-N(6)/adenine(1519)-N(6))-dimethyltransferase RsmA [Halobacteriales archaeon]|nr:16S rRNA (adenine(1518)-N(6)/adenine(1519)-N(6))-dimethyltransferase RsmA [Halobacteriales archaeon]
MAGPGGREANTDVAEPAGRREPAALLDRAGVRGDPRHDQHFLLDARVLDRIVGYAEGLDRTHVLEIGAGTGGLTDRLLAGAGAVTAIERDRRLAAFLRTEFSDAVDDGRLDVIQGDALDVDWPAYTACVSNLPYSASSELLFRLLPRGEPAVLLVQREFADRLVADPGTDEYGRLSVTAGHYADIERLEVVPPTAFDPRPAVESAVVRAIPRTPDYAVPDDERFLDLVTATFTQRRKTMRNAIRNTAHISGLAEPDAVVAAADDELLSRRPETVTPAEFAALCRLAADHGGWTS